MDAVEAPPKAAGPAAPRTIRIPFVGGDLSCEVTGGGPPFLLVHSVNAAASRAEMDALAERLAAGFRVYNLDLPGFGDSARPRLRYDVRRFVAAIEAAAAHILAAERTPRLDAAALSLGCEFLARAAARAPERYASLALISPTGFQPGADKLTGEPGSTLERPWLSAALSTRAGTLLYRALTLPVSIRFFLRRAFGRDDVDPHVLEAALAQARKPGAEHAPLAFVSGRLFSGDVTTLYRALPMPVFLAHGLRGSFSVVALDWPRERANWTLKAYDAGALPQVELPDTLAADIGAHARRARSEGAFRDQEARRGPGPAAARPGRGRASDSPP